MGCQASHPAFLVPRALGRDGRLRGASPSSAHLISWIIKALRSPRAGRFELPAPQCHLPACAVLRRAAVLKSRKPPLDLFPGFAGRNGVRAEAAQGGSLGTLLRSSARAGRPTLPLSRSATRRVAIGGPGGLQREGMLRPRWAVGLGQRAAAESWLLYERSAPTCKLAPLFLGLQPGVWTEAEDDLLALWQSQVGNKWSEVAKHIPGKTGQQCAQVSRGQARRDPPPPRTSRRGCVREHAASARRAQLPPSLRRRLMVRPAPIPAALAPPRQPQHLSRKVDLRGGRPPGGAGAEARQQLGGDLAAPAGPHRCDPFSQPRRPARR